MREKQPKKKPKKPDPIITDPQGCYTGRPIEAWDSPVPSGILGALWLANVLHNDLLTDADCAAKMDEYYETFYDFTYSEN